MNLFAVAALFAVTTFPMPTLHVVAPIAASGPVAATRMQNPSAIFYHPSFFRQQPQELSVCRLRAFFGSDVARPLETVYFARPGSPCAGVPLYGFVYLTR
jgi:hypothetical protein